VARPAHMSAQREAMAGDDMICLCCAAQISEHAPCRRLPFHRTEIQLISSPAVSESCAPDGMHLRSSILICRLQSGDVGLEVRERFGDGFGSHVDSHAIYEDGLAFDDRGGKHSQLGFIRTSLGL